MKSIRLQVGIFCCALGLPFAAAGAEEKITVYAASSLREVVGDVAKEFEKRTGAKVRTEFESSATLARQIKAGAAVDVFLSADADWMDEVKPKQRFDWLTNRLVCVTLPKAKKNCKDAGTIVLGGEQVPIGKYARAALTKTNAVKAKRVIEGSNVRDVLRKVAQGAGDAGVVYQTDAQIEPGVKVAYVFPADSHPPIIIPAGAMSEKGTAFWEALREEWALALARKRGFEIAK